jgi:hypothetical protein
VFFDIKWYLKNLTDAELLELNEEATRDTCPTGLSLPPRTALAERFLTDKVDGAILLEIAQRWAERIKAVK